RRPPGKQRRRHNLFWQRIRTLGLLRAARRAAMEWPALRTLEADAGIVLLERMEEVSRGSRQRSAISQEHDRSLPRCSFSRARGDAYVARSATSWSFSRRSPRGAWLKMT